MKRHYSAEDTEQDEARARDAEQGRGAEMSAHTAEQVENWKAYEEVRQGGQFNMYDPNARMLTGLERAEYRYCMEHYDTLKAQAESLAQEPT